MSEFRLDSQNLHEGLNSFEERALMAMSMYCETAAQDLARYMKEHRVWTDRTSQARQRLTAYVEKTDTGFRIVLAHGVDYGIWLELANEKRFAILEPTVRLQGPAVVKGFDHLLDRLGGLVR